MFCAIISYLKLINILAVISDIAAVRTGFLNLVYIYTNNNAIEQKERLVYTAICLYAYVVSIRNAYY